MFGYSENYQPMFFKFPDTIRAELKKAQVILRNTYSTEIRKNITVISPCLTDISNSITIIPYSV